MNPESFLLPIRVYYEDTDAGGVVYYANYLRFCERARTEYLRALGFSQQAMLLESNCGFVVTSVEADYLQGAVLDDLLLLSTAVAEMQGARLVFEQTVWRSEQKLFVCRVTIACMNMSSKRPQRIPTFLREQLALANPSDLSDPSSFSVPSI